jgi:hypothetical protein
MQMCKAKNASHIRTASTAAEEYPKAKTTNRRLHKIFDTTKAPAVSMSSANCREDPNFSSQLSKSSLSLIARRVNSDCTYLNFADRKQQRLIPNKPKVTSERVAPALEMCPGTYIRSRVGSILLEDDFGRQRILASPLPCLQVPVVSASRERRTVFPLSGVPPDPCHK